MLISIIVLAIALIVAIILGIKHRLLVMVLVAWMKKNGYQQPDKDFVSKTVTKILTFKEGE